MFCEWESKQKKISLQYQFLHRRLWRKVLLRCPYCERSWVQHRVKQLWRHLLQILLSAVYLCGKKKYIFQHTGEISWRIRVNILKSCAGEAHNKHIKIKQVHLDYRHECICLCCMSECTNKRVHSISHLPTSEHGPESVATAAFAYTVWTGSFFLPTVKKTPAKVAADTTSRIARATNIVFLVILTAK